MQKFVVLVVFLGILSLPLMAADNPKLEVFGGYQYLHTGDITIDGQKFANSSANWNGWDTSATYNFSKHIGVEGNFGGAYKTVSGVSTHVYTYTFGPKVSFPSGRIDPFAHVLFGGLKLGGSKHGQSESFNGFTMAFGGGLDVKASKVIAIRLAEFDWVYYHFGNQTINGLGTIPSFSQSNNVRIASGVVFRF